MIVCQIAVDAITRKSFGRERKKTKKNKGFKKYDLIKITVYY